MKIYIKSIFTFGFLSVALQVQGQTLNSYIEDAFQNNPNVQSFELKYERFKEKINEANTLPNTQFSVGYFASQPETRTGAQEYRLSVNQMLPWFGTISTRRNYLTSMVDAEYEDIAITKRKLAMAVTQSYYNLYAIKAKKKVLRDNILLLKTYEKLAITAVKVNRATAVDVLRLQIRQNELDEKIQILDQKFLAEQSAFNYLLNKDKVAIVEVPDNVGFPLESAVLNTDLLQNSELLKFDKLYKSVEQSELLNKIDSKPQIGLGLDYISVAKRPDLNFSDNGKDILMPMVSISIPIFNKKYRSVSRQNDWQKQEITAQKQERLNTLKTMLDKALSSQQESKISYSILEKNLKQAQVAENILIKSYETAVLNYSDVLDIQELQLKFQTSQIEAIKKYYMQQAIINYLLN